MLTIVDTVKLRVPA